MVKKLKKKRPSKKPAHTKKPNATKHKNNLNVVFASSVQTLRQTPQSFQNVENVSMFFDNIESHLISLILNPGVHYVLASSPWFSNQSMLSALAQKRGVGVLTHREKHSVSAIRSKAYHALRPFDKGFDRVRTLNRGKGRQCGITHTKFLVFLDAARQPIGCAFGSHNFSSVGGQLNLEMFCAVNDPRVAAALADEWHRVYSVSRCLL